MCVGKRCNFCERELPISDFLKDKRRDRYGTRCRICRRDKAREWRKSRPNYEKERYAADRSRTRERHLVRKYGITLVDYESMLIAQNNSCAICGAKESDQFKGVFHVDHCHRTGTVRGLLCRGCNHMLGVVGDDPDILLRAVEFIRAFDEVTR